MRLQQLSLDRFGHFTDKKIDIGESTDQPDFHIIYGPNEAGKTTTMEAAMRLFYGFPSRDNYDFKHQRKNLQVSGLLEIEGKLQHFTRLPKRSGALCDAAGIALPETALGTHLAGLTENDYRKLLCLDDETIERGGEEIARADGDIGRLLFSAAAGVADLSSVLAGIRESADGLWRKRATTTRIAQLKKELKEIEAEIRQLDISAGKWRDIKKQYADAQSAERDASDTCKRYRVHESQLQARRRALPKLKEIETLNARLTSFATYPASLDFDPEELVTLQSDRERLHADLERLASEISQTESALNSLERSPALVALSDRLDELDDLRARDVTASQDIERRRKEMQDEYQQMKNAARDLGVSDTSDPVTLVLSAANIHRLESTRDALRSAEVALATETAEMADLTERRDLARQSADKAAAKTAAEPVISNLLARFDIDRLLPAYSSALQGIETVGQIVNRALAELSAGPVTFDSLPMPTTSTIKAMYWEEEHAELSRKISESESALANDLQDIAARGAQIDKLKLDRNLITDAQAGSFKDNRDQLWQQHKDALSIQTAQAFENAMRALDSATDSRVVHAIDLGQLRQIEQSLVEVQARADQTRSHLEVLNNKRAAIESEVNDAASVVGMPTPMMPAEWLQWMKRYDRAVETSRDFTERKHSHQADIERMLQLRDELCWQLNLQTADVEDVLAQARTRAAAESDAIAEAKAATSKLEDIEDRLVIRQKKKQQALAEKQKCESDWLELVSGLFGDTTVHESLLRSLDPLQALRRHNDNTTRIAQRIEAMEKDQASFHREVDSLCASHALTMDDSAAVTFQRLRKQSRDARATEATASNLDDKLEKSKADLAARQQELDNLHSKVSSFGRIFPEGVAVDTLEALRKVVTDAQQVIKDREHLCALELAVTTELNVDSILQARDLLKDATQAELHAETEATASDLRIADQRLTQATETRVLAEKSLSDITAGSELASLNERKSTIELELEDTAMEYLALDLGHALADDAIHRYRDTHRSGMMTATERCFNTLTQGAYPKLTIEPDAGKETLLAIDKDGTAKRVDALSKGTRFQLYLALRAAAHEQMVNQGTSLPFFCDDIFETFDEARTSAACQVMEQIGHRGQAIYLTHHRHVVEIAQDVCSVSPKIHEI